MNNRNPLAPLPDDFADTRSALHRLAVYVISPARRAHTGKIGLRPTIDGFGTPGFDAGGVSTQVRVEHGWLAVEADGDWRGLDLVDGAVSLRRAAAFVGVELDLDAEATFDVPPAGDLDAPLIVGRSAAVALGDWYRFAASVLRTVRASAGDDAESPTMLQIWPEHFDLAMDLGDESAGTRTNVGGSPGDGFSDEPYLYVGPWNRDSLEGGIWNAPFGAVVGYSDLMAAPIAWTAAAGFVASARVALAAVRG